jgi:hypothetical protein
MAYRHDGSGMGGGPVPEKTKAWAWGFLFGALVGSFGVVIAFLRF